MIKSIISIRIKQFSRIVQGIGLFRVVFMIGIIGVMLIGIFLQLNDTKTAYYITGGFICIILIIQLIREDKIFLKIHFDNYRFIYLVEHSVLALPLIISLIYHHCFLQTFCLLVSLPLVVNIEFKKKQRSLNTKIQRLIPPDCFEWKSGARKTFFFVIIPWILGIVTSFFVASVPVVIFFIGIIPIGFYNNCEPIQMILGFEMSTNRFLKHKIKTHLILFSVLTLPLILLFMMFHSDLWYIPVIEYFIFIFVHIYTILTKYAFFVPNQKLNPSMSYSILGAFSIFFFVLIPLIWILSVYFYFKSSRKLNFYLNDYN